MTPIQHTTPNAIRCHLAAMAQEARRRGCRFDWALDDIADGSLNSDIHPAGKSYFNFDLNAKGNGFHASYGCIIADNEILRTLEYARDMLDSYTAHIAAMRRNHQPMQAFFDF